MTASEIVSGFLEKVGTPEFETADGPFYVARHGLVTEPKLTSLVWKFFRVSPKRSVVADAYATLLALSRDGSAEPEPEPEETVPEPLPQPETHSEEPLQPTSAAEPVVVPTAPEALVHVVTPDESEPPKKRKPRTRRT